MLIQGVKKDCACFADRYTRNRGPYQSIYKITPVGERYSAQVSNNLEIDKGAIALCPMHHKEQEKSSAMRRMSAGLAAVNVPNLCAIIRKIVANSVFDLGRVTNEQS
jgi:hypothetical protein